MPKFTQEELEEIRRNTEEVEKARRGKKGRSSDKEDATAKSPKKKRASKKTIENYTVKDRMVALILLILSVIISVAVWQLYS